MISWNVFSFICSIKVASEQLLTVPEKKKNHLRFISLCSCDADGSFCHTDLLDSPNDLVALTTLEV